VRRFLLGVAVLVVTGACEGVIPVTAPDSVSYDLFTHCGVIAVDYKGARYYADPPNPPGRWANPFDHGRLTPAGAGKVVFTDAAGNRAVFATNPAAGIPTIYPCD
jgi:hypothetical protein